MFLLLEGSLCIPISMALLQLSVYFTKASTAAVMMSTNPIFMVIFSYFILGERINKRTIGAIIISFIGVLFIFNPLKISYDIKGMLIALLAAVTFSLYSVLSKKRISIYGGYIFNFLALY
ncbi:DMT family transporter [Caloramator sp. Dgby_cultured_2]|uniref:DMT family transporter n=1 Tax=Caloramator sp. Dgby_cultured_2 TaxID=3029174 RepID=UPI00237ED4CC|nr:DMT family transporter [Caloramator sp. Dgby_cultured_2]WDU83017.1 DMT family transporter [Caloramator sp. Dgby_cultured_2]